jgi:hypothetical protein
MNKNVYERMAKLILKYYVNKNCETLQVKDCPDLQSVDLDLGVEVTRGISSDIGYMQSIVDNGILNDGLTEDEIGKLKTIGKFIEGRRTSDERQHGAIMPFHGDLQVSIIIIQNRIFEKSTKLVGNHYKKFKENYLFIYVESPIIDVDDVSDIIFGIKSLIAYEKVYFFLQNKELVEYVKKTNDLRSIKNQTQYGEVLKEFNS